VQDQAARERAIRGLLRALGFDPEKHRGEVVTKSQVSRASWEGFRITDLEGNPIKFVSRKALRRLYKDAAAQEAFAVECPPA
jgi:hypothetical protein